MNFNFLDVYSSFYNKKLTIMLKFIIIVFYLHLVKKHPF